MDVTESITEIPKNSCMVSHIYLKKPFLRSIIIEMPAETNARRKVSRESPVVNIVLKDAEYFYVRAKLIR